MAKPRKGDRLVYTGEYAPCVPEDAKYGAGTVVGFRDYGETVWVQFDDGLYAYWPINETAPAGEGDSMRPARFTITQGGINRTYEVVFEHIGEGFNGDYDPNDPNDMALWRLDLIDGNGEQVDEASWCTKLGVDELTPEQLHRVGIWIAARVSKAMIEEDVSVPRLWDALSHLDKSWTTDITTFNVRLNAALLTSIPVPPGLT